MSEPAHHPGERTIIDRHDAAELDPADPNVAAGVGDYDHTQHIGEPVDDDHGVAAAGALLDSASGGNTGEQGA